MNKTALIADIGGTNARFGIVDGDGVRNPLWLKCSDYKQLNDAIGDYLHRIGEKPPMVGVLAVAGAVEGDLVDFLNLPWSFSQSQVQKDFGFKTLDVMNDFTAVAYGIDGIAPGLLRKIGGGEPVARSAKAIIGPGTGLGVSALIWDNGKYSVPKSEGGHITMPFKTEREFRLSRQIMQDKGYTHISAERVCSGRGLENLYTAIRNLDQKSGKPESLDAPEISQRAIAGDCEICIEALDLMLGFLGRIASDFAVTFYATGGVYIAGGIPTKLGETFFKSRFLEEFHDKGRYRSLMESMPVYLVQHDAIGLLGLEKRAQILLRNVPDLA